MADSQFWLQILAHYGYAMLFAGTFLEGETVLMFAGILAHEGYFSLPLVAFCAFAGSLASDQLMFFLGRRYGASFLRKRPRLRRASARVEGLIRRHEHLLILGFRFVWGIRNTAPIVLGLQGVNPRTFFLLNCLGAAVWAVLFTFIGYAFGSMVDTFFGRLHADHHAWIVVSMIVVLVLSLLAWFRLWRR